MKSTEFRSISSPVEDVLLKEKSSKFIGYAYNIRAEQDIKLRIDQIRKLHPKATHICYALRLGEAGDYYRIHDAGEPSGSAGIPIYNQLLSHHLTDILLFVVRYFGGTKLGIKGLIKSYKDAARQTLEKAEIITREIQFGIELRFDFSQQNRVFLLLEKSGAQVEEFRPGEKCFLRALVRVSTRDFILSKLREIKALDFVFPDS